MRSLIWNVVVNLVVASGLTPARARASALRLLGADVDRTAEIRRGVDFYGPNIRIGKHVFINSHVQIQNFAHVEIGDDVFIGPGALISTLGHETSNESKRAGWHIARPVVIRSGAWIAARAVILPGVTIEQGVVVAAGAVVTSDCRAHGVYGGVPAKRISDLPSTQLTRESE